MPRKLLFAAAVLGLSAGVLAAAGFFSLGCCSPTECGACPVAFCKQTVTVTSTKAALATPAIATLFHSPRATPAPLAWVEEAPLTASFHGALPPLRN